MPRSPGRRPAPTRSLNLDTCEILTVAHAGEGDWSARRCPGRNGITLFVNEDDARFDVDAGVDNGEWESPAPLNELGPQVEWRSEGGRPFAIIYRYTIPEAMPGGRSMLAVESIGRTGRPGCLVALIRRRRPPMPAPGRSRTRAPGPSAAAGIRGSRTSLGG